MVDDVDPGWLDAVLDAVGRGGGRGDDDDVGLVPHSVQRPEQGEVPRGAAGPGIAQDGQVVDRHDEGCGPGRDRPRRGVQDTVRWSSSSPMDLTRIESSMSSQPCCVRISTSQTPYDMGEAASPGAAFSASGIVVRQSR